MKRYVLPSAVFVFSLVFISGIFASNIWLAFGAMMDLQNTAQAPTNFCVKNPLKTLLQAQLHGCIA